jgi:hypothetical protein
MGSSLLAIVAPANRIDASHTSKHDHFAQSQRFDLLMQQGSAQPSAAVDASVADRYTDIASSTAQASSRPVVLPADWVAAGQKFNDDFQANRLEFDKHFNRSELELPFVKHHVAQLAALTKLQESMSQYQIFMKGIEMSNSSVQQLFKMQG